MPFLKISPVNFRNLNNETIDLSAKEVFFTGENGQGKSNLLEALYYSSYGSSFRTHNDNELIKNGENSMSVRSMFREESGSTHMTAIVISNKTKKIEKDGKTLYDRKDLINTMPCVLYNHDDLDFVIGSPERKRFFIDQTLSMHDVMYIDTTRRYKRVLKNRNISLKEKKYSLLESYDIQLVQYGLEIQQKRKTSIFQFNEIFGKLYENVTGIDGVKINYVPSWQSENPNIPSVNGVLDEILKKREAEKIMCTTMSGPHRDRINFIRKGVPFVPKASTGQRRLIALILRTAQAIFYHQVTNKKPVLLMDDVLLELDPDKRQKVTSLLPEYDQLFCTFLNGEPYERYKKSSTKVYKIEKGGWTLTQ
ncbi:MAG: DNA replication and repair protein RecF [Spirochaetia bacterium]|nr:DNA replication and repair protein RecF [Spirochaetia bacterium]